MHSLLALESSAYMHTQREPCVQPTASLLSFLHVIIRADIRVRGYAVSDQTHVSSALCRHVMKLEYLNPFLSGLNTVMMDMALPRG